MGWELAYAAWLAFRENYNVLQLCAAENEARETAGKPLLRVPSSLEPPPAAPPPYRQPSGPLPITGRQLFQTHG